MRKRILLADDHRMVLQGLSELVEREFDVVGTVSDGAQLLEAIPALRPDVIVCDMAMPGVNGIEVLRRLHQAKHDIPVIVLSMHQDAALVKEALRLGARGYVLKQSAGDELIAAIRSVLNGNVYVASTLAGGPPGAAAASGRGEGRMLVSRRQRDVVRLIAAGCTMKEVSESLGISVRTAESHKYDAMRKLGITTLAELVQVADHLGLLADANLALDSDPSSSLPAPRQSKS